ncbi:MAG: hypothetical protein A2283_22615 [Lentisphaerae bacterium RIFOXYA12_FULL_48_11]|nr:MAG: hypothetical protein A2283_22615 [Lentisphaerae bacterium RIFOXYA12_FULL_48_11]
MDWFYSQNGERKGPVELEAIKALVAAGTLSKNNLVWNQNMGSTWTKIGDVPVLAGPQAVHDDPMVKQEFQRKLEERNQLLAQQRRAAVRGYVVAAAVAVLLIAGVTLFIKTAPRRAWGLSSSCPIGTLAKLESRLVTMYQMEKEQIPECVEITKTAVQKFRYSNPKCERGAHVSARGTITVLADGEGRIQAILGAFPSPGQHGYTLVDRSLVSVFMNELWEAHGGTEERIFQVRENVLSSLGNSCGLAGIPNDGVCAVIEKARMRSIWIEFGPNTVNTMVYFETK